MAVAHIGNPARPGSGLSMGDNNSPNAQARNNRPRLGAILLTIPIRGPNVNQAVQGPAINVPEGCTVEVLPIPNQVNSARFSTVSPGAAVSGPFELILASATFPREINIRNLSQLYVVPGGSNEGVQVTVRRPQQ
jgi:hypothetical protein